jgi:LysM repeat protein
VSRSDLAEANNLTLRSRVASGQQLIIPRAPTTVLSARLDRTAPAGDVIAAARPLSGVASPAVDAVTASAATTAKVQTADESNEPDLAKVVYRVKRGDTLFAIARLFKTSVAALKSWNRLRTNIIAPGDRLTIFSTRTLLPSGFRSRS